MRTVQSLRDELANFPADALCYAYEGEVTGIVILPAAPARFGPRLSLGCVICQSGEQADTEVERRGMAGEIVVETDEPAIRQPAQG